MAYNRNLRRKGCAGENKRNKVTTIRCAWQRASHLDDALWTTTIPTSSQTEKAGGNGKLLAGRHTLSEDQMNQARYETRRPGASRGNKRKTLSHTPLINPVGQQFLKRASDSSVQPAPPPKTIRTMEPRSNPSREGSVAQEALETKEMTQDDNMTQTWPGESLY